MLLLPHAEHRGEASKPAGVLDRGAALYGWSDVACKSISTRRHVMLEMRVWWRPLWLPWMEDCGG